jgi:type I restriction enzyme S subunit
MSSQTSSIGSCPSHWDVVKFSTVAELKHGYQFRTTDFTDQGVKVLKITQIKDNGSIDISSCSFIDSKRLESFEKNIVNKGDILMALSGATIGKIGRYKSEEIVLQNYRVGNFIPLNEEVLNKDYFYHFLTTENTYYQILANQNQSAQENIGKEDIHNMLVFIPPFPEQTATASILTSLDDKIDLLHRQNATLEKMAETLFRQWFVEEAKEDWEVKPLGSLVTVKRGGSPRPIQDYLSDTGLRWLKISDATKENSPYIFEIKEHIKVEGLNKTTFLKAGTLVLSNSATPGIPKILHVDTCIHDGWLHFPKSHFSNEFLYLFFKSIRPELLQLGNGSIFTNLKTDILKEYELPIPDSNSLMEFDNLIKPTFYKLYSNTIQIRTLTALRDTLLPKLMSGEVRVNIDEMNE